MKTRSKVVNRLLVKAIDISVHEGLTQVFLAEVQDCHHLWQRKRFIAGELAVFYPQAGRWVLYNSGFISSSELLTTVSVSPQGHEGMLRARRELFD